MEINNTFSRGSEWRKWDLHVHTKGTNKNDQFSSVNMESFLYTFFKKAIENKIDAIGITDYFSIDNFIEAKEYQNKIDYKLNEKGEKIFTETEIGIIKRIFLFPNVELRMVPSTDKGRLINIHCIFNPTYVEELENDFFSEIENQDKYKMNRHGIISYGYNLDSSIKDEKKQYEKGIQNFVIDLTVLKSIIEKNKRFKENVILVVSNSNKDGASAIQKHYDLFENENGNLDGLRKSIYKISDCIFSNNIKDVKYFLGKRLEEEQDYSDEIFLKEKERVISERGSLKACLSGSDAHKEEDLFTKYTWIKGDLNFEGLRQIVFEPEQRVKIQQLKPDNKEEKLIIDSVKFITPKNTFTSKPIYLNDNLNVIIGGKSSGKSILLYSIAKTLLPDFTLLQNEDGTMKYDLNKLEENFDFEITTKGGFSQKMNHPKSENSILPEIKYIPQNYLVKLAEPELNKKGKSLNKLVRDLIIEDEDSKLLYQNFVSTVSNNDKIRNGKIETFFEVQNEIKNLEIELKSKSNKEVLIKNIETNTKKVEDLNKSTGLTPEQLIEYKKLQDSLELNKLNIQKFREDFRVIQEFDNILNQTILDLKQRKGNVINSISNETIKTHYTNLYSKIDAFYTEITDIIKYSQTETKEDGKSYFKSESVFNNVLSNLNTEQNNLVNLIQPFLKDEQVKKIIEDINVSISNDKKSLLEIETLSTKITEKYKYLELIKTELLDMYEENYNEYVKTLLALKNRTDELEKDGLKILGKVQFNYPKLRKAIYEVSDGRTASYSQYSILDNNKKAIDENEFSQILGQVKLLFDDILNQKYALNKSINIENAIKLVLDDYFFDYWEITYKNDKLGVMSTGKASFVILMLIIGLSKSKAPILIDQPEDNLDNRSITSDLVSYLKNKKLERQIIIVTHNANVVVNADAENVIVANQKGQNDDKSSSPFKFDYINGAIENSFEKNKEETDILKSMGVRQHIADLVEGGKEAFMMREKKYRFSL